jgi:endonuclease III
LDELNSLVNFIYKNISLEKIIERESYNHMGATISDAILQSGMNYEKVVYPRIKNLICEYPDFTTTCDFIILMNVVDISELLNWHNYTKVQRIKNLALFFYNNNINDEIQLSRWLDEKENINQLLQINGIGPKTVDYLKLLSGIQSIPIDRHLFKFLELAGIETKQYNFASFLYNEAANILHIEKKDLDYNIWNYMRSNPINIES